MQDTREMLLVTSNFPPEVGGPAKFTNEFSVWLRQQGVNCSIITTHLQSRNYGDKGIRVVSISRNQNTVIRFIRTSIAMRRYGGRRPALVNGLFYEALLAHVFLRFTFTAKVPSDIVWDRARNKNKTDLSVDEFQGRESWVYKIQRWAFTQSLKVAKRVIVPSAHLASLVAGWGIPKERIFLIRNSHQIPLGRNSEEPTVDVISVGRLIPLKGNVELIEVCANLGLSLKILGDGPEEGELRELASELGSEVEFLGSLPGAQVISQIRASRVFVLNSSHEGSPNALIEAMTQGSVCVVRENPGTMELIQDLQNGIFANCSRTLSEALKMAVFDIELRKRVSSGALMFARIELNQDVNFKRIFETCVS